MEKILLVTDSWDSSFLSDGFLKSQLADYLPRQDLAVYLLDSVQDGVSESNLRKEGYTFHKHVLRRKPVKPPFFLRRIRFVFVYLQALWIRYFETKKTVAAIRKYSDDNLINKIWIVIQGPTLLWVAEELVKVDPNSVYVQYSYSGSTWTKNERLDRVTEILAQKSKYSLFQSARHIAVESDRAKNLVPQAQAAFLPYLKDKSMTVKNNLSDRFIIGMIGPLKGKEAFSSLVSALDSVYWEIDGKKVEIYFWGSGELPLDRTRTIRKSFRGLEQILHEIEVCNLIYCPFSFDRRLTERTTNSFPQDMTLALRTQVPFLYHGPCSGYAPYWIRDLGHFCFSDDIEVVKMHLRKAIYVSTPPDQVVAERQAKLAELSEARQQETFVRFLKLEAPQQFELNARGDA